MLVSQIKALIFVAQVAALAAAGSAYAAAGSVYVADEGANTVTVIDAASFKQIGNIPVGKGPHNVQVSPDGKWVWVTNNGDAAKAAETMSSKEMLKAEHGAMAAAGAVRAVDTATGSVVAEVPVGKHPAHVEVAGDGRTAYITNGGDNTVSVVDTAAQRVIGVIPVGAAPHGLRISPDGKQVWVANLKGGTVSVIGTGSRKQVMLIPVGKAPAQAGFTPDGRFGFVSLSEENKCMKVAATIETGAGAHGVVVDHDGRRAFATNTDANTVSVIDITARKVVATVPVGKGTNGISMTP